MPAMLGIDPMRQRDMQDEALSVIIPLLAGERVSHECDWFGLHDAELQIHPHQESIPMAVASSISPSGMRLAGKYGIGVLSIASNSTEGLLALPTQWSFAEESAAAHGRTVSRGDWRVLMAWHLAETREQARAEAVDGLQRWNNDYNVAVLGRPDATHHDDKWELLDNATAAGAAGAGAAVIGTPDDMVAAIRSLQELTGGLGTVIGFAHDWASPEASHRSWELFARYVVPELQGQVAPLRRVGRTRRREQGDADGRGGRGDLRPDQQERPRARGVRGHAAARRRAHGRGLVGRRGRGDAGRRRRQRAARRPHRRLTALRRPSSCGSG